MRPKIQLSGRLGNQLFQWSFAHLLSISRNTSVSLFTDDYHHGNSNKSEIWKFFNCDHVIDGGPRDSLGLQLRSLDWVYSRNPEWSVKISELLGWNRSMDANQVPQNLRKGYKFSGFYQDYEQVLRASNVIKDELIGILDQNSPGVMKEIPSEFQFVHIRRGDLVNLSSSYGLLGFDWYRDNLDSKLPIVASTDDLEGSKDLLNMLKPDFVLKPSEYTALETLAVMSNSKRLIMGNSTLSWWGGYSATIRGGVSIFPDPFYLTNRFGSDKLCAPMFKVRPAKFIAG
jgi:Glycosyl transferase family 11